MRIFSSALRADLCVTVALLAFGPLACGNSGSSDTGPGTGDITNMDGDAPLSDWDELFEGAPDSSTLPNEDKADQVFPLSNSDLVATQSAVKSQGRRGVCSIFSTVALMEHLYITEGTITDPDFSEQYLQWAAKVKVGAFPHTAGSSASRNLEAISRFGIVEEAAWPYEISQWNTSNDAECTDEKNLPTRCYTNGDPPESISEAKLFKLPRGRWISSRVRSIKAHMTNKKTAAVVGLTFFYQSWNHRRSELKTNNANWRKGVVLYPNEEDKTKSLEKRAGHSILLVGWEDELEVAQRDSEGNAVLDADGNEVMEKGFFIFKNSWGTGSFGVENPHGDGYGYISYRYVEEYGTTYSAGLPEVEKPVEICGDGMDNDNDGAADCDDTDCAADASCAEGTSNYENQTSMEIPDNDATGISSVINVPDAGFVKALTVSFFVEHSYPFDLSVELSHGDESVTLVASGSTTQGELSSTYTLTDFNGLASEGDWTLKIADHAARDTGKLAGWTMEIDRCATEGCADVAVPVVLSAEPGEAIPDDNEEGITSKIEVTEGGEIAELTVDVDISHTFVGDLTLILEQEGGESVTLREADASSGTDLKANFRVSDFNGTDSTGVWRLRVIDAAARDTGTLNSWTMTLVHK